MDWLQLRKQRRNEESRCLAVMCVLLLGAAAIDAYVRLKGPIWSVDNYDGISLVVIQIQATIQTLSIALLALISSHTTDSIFGISAIDFQFRIVPVCFAQEWLIKGGLILLAGNVFFHMAGFFNLVLAVFLVACCFIWISINQIYAVFAGKGAPEQEVEAYLLYTVQQHPSVPQRTQAFTAFCDDWVRKCESQNNTLFHLHRELFGKMLDALAAAEEEQGRSVVQQKSAEIIHALSFASNPNVRWRSFSFLSFCYEKLWGCISAHKDRISSLKGSVHILDEAFRDIMELIRDSSIEEIEKQLSWDNLIEYIIACFFWLGYDADKPAELLSVGDFSAWMGWKLANSPAKYDDDCDFLKHWNYASCLLPPNAREAGIQALAQVRLKFSIALIRSGGLEILRKNFYHVALRNRERIRESPDAILVLEIHGYLYYISEWEGTDCVPQELKQACKNFIESEDIRHLFWSALDRIARLDYGFAQGNRQQVFSDHLIDTVTSQLRIHEFFPRDGIAKTMCLGSALEEFLVFCASCVSSKYDYIHAVQNIIEEKAAVSFYHRYILQPTAKERLTRFLTLTLPNHGDASQTAGHLLEQLAIVLLAKIHDYALREAAAAQAVYEQEVDEALLKGQQKAEILEYLRGVFCPLLSEEAKDSPKQRITLLSLRDITSAELEKNIRQFHRNLPSSFVEWLCLWAKENGLVEQKRKNEDFPDDVELMDFLAQDAYPLILGSDLTYFVRDWHNQEQMLQILSKKTYIPEGPYGQGLLLKTDGIRLYLHDVEVEIDFCGISSVSFHVDPQSGDYQHEFMGVTISFTKEELQQYLHDYYKTVRINLIFSIHQEPGALGYLLLDP